MFEIIKNKWSQSSFVSKLVFFALLAILLLVFLYSVMWAMKEDYQVLFSDLNSRDAANMIAELDRMKVPYQLAENGSSILVEKDAVYKTRLKLVGKGLNLNGTVGFELFNNSEFGMTEFAQKVNYLRALQGELERTIMGFEEIKSARVHLVLPESGLFKRKDAVPKASVSLSIKDNLQLTSEQILGIQKLVSASVPEVTVADVTIVDQRGVALTKGIVGNDGETYLYERLDVKKQLENYMTQKLIGVLDRAVGSGKAIVSVDVSLNYDQVKITKEDVIPLPHTSGQSVGAISRKRMTHQIDEASNSATNNLFNDDQESNGQNMPPSASMSEIEYINNRRVEQVLSSPGAINKLSVGVLVPNVNDPIKLAKIKEVVSMTAGINAARGDGLVVNDIDIPSFADGTVEAKIVNTDLVDTTQHAAQIKQEANSKTAPLFWYYLLLGSVVILSGLYFLSRKKSADENSMGVEDRAKFLAEINTWASSQGLSK